MAFEHHVLFIDAYDSFSHNIIALLKEACRVHITRIYIDAYIPDLGDFLSGFSAIVCGPGPGHPARMQDVGLFKKIWTVPDDRLVPTLGICLGFQSLAYEFGASVIPLPQPRHGIKSRVTSASKSIFHGLANVDIVQYHSLHVLLDSKSASLPTDNDLWKPNKQCPDLLPLAWDLSSQGELDPSFNKNPLPILMAVKHVNKPFYGVQFHPESICSDPPAKQIITNWWQIALAKRPRLKPRKNATEQNRPTNLGPIYGNSNNNNLRTSFELEGSTKSNTPTSAISFSPQEKVNPKVLSASLPADHFTIPSICEALNVQSHELIVLDSEMRQLPQLGEASIIGVILPETKKIQYSRGKNETSIQSRGSNTEIHLSEFEGNIFAFLKAFMASYAVERDDERAFCGGLMGYVSYEACLETIGIDTSTPEDRPDLCFAFIERSILVDHKRHLLHVQGLQYDEADCSTSKWIDDTISVLKDFSENKLGTLSSQDLSFSKGTSRKVVPEESSYRSRIIRCQEQIRAGESYELCLTDRTHITTESKTSAWSMYTRLRRLNPAPFSAFIQLGHLTLLSTSPERFMKWSRFKKAEAAEACGSETDEQLSKCQFRPMKGTVRKKQEMLDGSVHHVSREEATAILAAPKEQAENLMILDLIRHDLHGICRDISVPNLMVVEEYESVYQLVSVIEGTISKPSCLALGESKSGIDCLAASLPPGSMTGAPKKRSCQLLHEIEEKPRSVYSGVLGYMDISGNGDFSVVIRSMYRWDDECGADSDQWNIGAGGAVTALSTEDGEWEEMLTKLRSTLRLFES
ncbi:MAG: hypothetical protein Q9225_004335 [Loekoesia sp. 1 TL-2023]